MKQFTVVHTSWETSFVVTPRETIFCRVDIDPEADEENQQIFQTEKEQRAELIARIMNETLKKVKAGEM